MLNSITIMGRLTREPELRRTGNETPVASFTLAVERDTKGQNGERETDFIECVAWRKTAEFVASYFDKGSMAIAKGRLQIRKYTDKDGNKRTAAEVVAESVYFGESKSNSGKQENGAEASVAAESGSFPDTMNYISQMSELPASQFAMLDDDDAQLPF